MEITIGNYLLKPYHDYPDGEKSVWIEEVNSGEGGQFSVKSLEAVIKEYYDKNF